MSQEKFDDALSDPMNKVKTSNDVLMKAFWYIVASEKITHARYCQSVNDFAHDERNVRRQTPTARTEMKSNLRQQLVKDRLSWKIFNRAIRAIGIVKADMVFRYSFDGDNMKEFTLPILTMRKTGGRNSGRTKASTVKTDDGSDSSNG